MSLLRTFSKAASGPFGNTDKDWTPVFLVFEGALPVCFFDLAAMVEPEATIRARQVLVRYPDNDFEIEFHAELNAILASPIEALEIAAARWDNMSQEELDALAAEHGTLITLGEFPLPGLVPEAEKSAELGWFNEVTRELARAG